MRLLYIEDDPAAQQYIFKGLGEHGFLVEVVSDGSTGTERATHGAYDLIILDVMLPDMEGFEVLRAGGVEVTEGVLAEECAELNLIFNHWMATGRPLLRFHLFADGQRLSSEARARWLAACSC